MSSDPLRNGAIFRLKRTDLGAIRSPGALAGQLARQSPAADVVSGAKASAQDNGWHFLHTTAAQLPDKQNITAAHLEAFRSIFRSLEVIYPCEECRDHLVQNMKRMRSLDSVVDAPSALVWTCELHNIVNEAQKKPLFTCDPEILAKKWSNPNCGCRSKKSDDSAAAGLQRAPDPPASVASPTAAQGEQLQNAPTPTILKSPQVKAEAILKAQAKISANVSPPPAVKQDSDADRGQEANAESVPDRVVLPDGEEAAGD